MGAKKEEKKIETAVPATDTAPAAPRSYSLTMFKPSGDIASRLEKAKRVTLPRLLLPKDIPVYDDTNKAILIATVVKGSNSPSSTVKGKCLWIRLENGEEMLLPVTGAIRQGLAPGIDADSKELLDALNKLAGKTFAFKRLADVPNKKYGKDQFIFDIFEL